MGADRSPLSGLTVVVTRSASDNASLSDRLVAVGAEVVAMPLVEVTAPTDGGRALQDAIERLTEYRYVVLTSANAVRAVADTLADHPWPPRVTAVPVGPSTETLARSLGMTVDKPPSVATAAALVEAFPLWDGVGSNVVLAPLGQLAADTTVDGLQAKGYRVDRVEAYRTAAPTARRSSTETAPNRAKTDDGLVESADAVTLFSPSVADRFADALADAGTPRFSGVAVCIGPSTAARARERGLDPIVVAEPHTEAGVLSALVSLFAPGG